MVLSETCIRERRLTRAAPQGLHNYIIMPFEEQLQYKSNFQHGAANEDSSNRQRSSSLVRDPPPRQTRRQSVVPA